LYNPVMNTTERTLVLIKHDAILRGLVGTIIDRFEKNGLKIVAGKFKTGISKKFAQSFYMNSKEWKLNVGTRTINTFNYYGYKPKKCFNSDDPVEIGNKIYVWTVDYLIKGPVLALVLAGPFAITRTKEVIGSNYINEQTRGTIRADFSIDNIISANSGGRAMYNLAHRSSNVTEAQKDINLWFKQREIGNYTTAYEIIHKSRQIS